MVHGGEILTNAHVVAGATTVTVIDTDGTRRPAAIEAFDASADAALLRIDLTVGPPLAFATAATEEDVSIPGHPGGGPLRVAPAAVRDKVEAIGRDLFDRRPARRSVLVLAVRLAPGDSGAPVLNHRGEVVGMAFAIAPDRPGTAYALDRLELERFLTNRPAGAIDAQRCIG